MDAFKQQLEQLSAKNQYRSIPDLVHQGRYITRENRKMLNMSSNDYLGLASNENLRQSFFYSNMAVIFLFYQFFVSFINGKFSCLYRFGRACRTTFPTGKRVIVQQRLSRQYRHFACFDDGEKFDFGR